MAWRRGWRWRDRVASKRLLLLLDDAVGHEQIRPLLPGTGGSVVLITSRRHITALEGARSISLDTLAPSEAAVLMTRLAARPDLAADDAAVAQITLLCGYLPLAIGMLARQLHHHPAWTPANLATELGAARDRLDLMQAENRSVAAALDLSYQDLSVDEQRLFRRLGLYPGIDIDAYAAAALDGTDLATARHHLAALYDLHLLTEPQYGRYRLHDLIREHARSLATTDSATHLEDAVNRLLDYYQYAANMAGDLISRARTRPGRAVLMAPPVVIPDLPDSVRALSWARTERVNMLACLDYATLTGQAARAIAITASLGALLRQMAPGPMRSPATARQSSLRGVSATGWVRRPP